MSTGDQRADLLALQVTRGELELDPPYQRGAVWTEDQRVALIRSLISGIPVPALIINARPVAAPDQQAQATYAVIDGKQRLLTVTAWFTGKLAVPASWFPAELVAVTVDTADGPYVTFDGLTETGRGFGSRAMLSVRETALATVAEEAAVYVLVNGAGTPQSDSDLAAARRVASGR
jgi:hypothetical protein